jgi:hypothetical protein
MASIIKEGGFMFQNKKALAVFVLLIAIIFSLTSCANLPLIGKKKKDDKADNLPEGKTVTIEGMEKIKGANPSNKEPLPPKNPTPQKKETGTKLASIPSRPFYSSPLPFFQSGFKKKVAILDFENKTTYKDEKIGEVVAKKLLDKLEASQRVIAMDKTVVSDLLNREGFKFESLTDPSVMKRAYLTLGIQAFALGTVTDVSLLSSKGSDASEEETTFATSKVEIRLIDASTGNLLRTFIGRSPIFGTKETGESSRGKAVVKAIELSLDDILDGFLRQLDILEWTTSVARVEGENLYINAGKLSGLRIGDTLEIYEPGKEIVHPTTNVSLGWTTGQLKGIVQITNLFGVDAAIGKVVQGGKFSINDVVKFTVK